jgi:hypothetical protein
LNVASFISLRGFDHQDGMRPHRIRTSSRLPSGDVDLRALDWHFGAAVTALIPALSCRSCRPNAPFAELLKLSRSSVADEWNVERGRAVIGE